VFIVVFHLFCVVFVRFADQFVLPVLLLDAIEENDFAEVVLESGALDADRVLLEDGLHFVEVAEVLLVFDDDVGLLDDLLVAGVFGVSLHVGFDAAADVFVLVLLLDHVGQLPLVGREDLFEHLHDVHVLPQHVLELLEIQYLVRTLLVEDELSYFLAVLRALKFGVILGFLVEVNGLVFKAEDGVFFVRLVLLVFEEVVRDLGKDVEDGFKFGDGDYVVVCDVEKSKYVADELLLVFGFAELGHACQELFLVDGALLVVVELVEDLVRH